MAPWLARARAQASAHALLGACVVGPVVTCGVLALVRAQLPNTDDALILVVVVVALASAGRRTAGYLATLAAAVSFDYFLTVPYYRLEMTHGTDVRTGVLVLLVGAAVTEIGVAARRQRARADEGSDLLAVISSVATQAAALGSSQTLITQVAREIERVLGARAVRFERTRAPLDGSRPRLQQDGRVVWGEVVWDVDRLGLPGEDIDLPVRTADLAIGRYVVVPNPDHPCPLQRRVVAVVLADQVAAVLARGRAPRPLPVA